MLYFISIYHSVEVESESEAQDVAAEMARVLCQYAAICNVDVEVEAEH